MRLRGQQLGESIGKGETRGKGKVKGDKVGRGMYKAIRQQSRGAVTNRGDKRKISCLQALHGRVPAGSQRQKGLFTKQGVSDGRLFGQV